MSGIPLVYELTGAALVSPSPEAEPYPNSQTKMIKTNKSYMSVAAHEYLVGSQQGQVDDQGPLLLSCFNLYPSMDKQLYHQ